MSKSCASQAPYLWVSKEPPRWREKRRTARRHWKSGLSLVPVRKVLLTFNSQ